MSAPLTRARLARDVFFLSVILALAAIAALSYGPEGSGLWRAFTGGAEGQLDRTILLSVRIPRLALGVAVGASLGAAGAALQALLQNPLADPYVLGLSGGAALGGTVALAATSLLAAVGLSLGPLAGIAPQAASFLGAGLAIAVMWRLARVAGEVSPHTLLLDRKSTR